MKKIVLKVFLACAFVALAGTAATKFSHAADKAVDNDPDLETKADAPADAAPDKIKEEAPAEEAVEAPAAKPARAARRSDRADAFVAGADWEFDGFVAGGQDEKVRSMFYLNDLIYVNIGAQNGIATGDKVGIYKRGDKIRDPQTGKFIGFEVRRAAIARATDRVEDEVAAVRITNTYEAVEIGDLVRKEQ